MNNYWLDERLPELVASFSAHCHGMKINEFDMEQKQYLLNHWFKPLFEEVVTGAADTVQQMMSSGKEIGFFSAANIEKKL